MGPAEHFWTDFDQQFVNRTVSTSPLAAGSLFLMPVRKSSLEKCVFGVLARRGTP